MQIRKLTKWEEWYESDRIIGTAFLHGWNETEAEEKARKQGAGEIPREEDAWGAFDDEGHMLTSFVTSSRDVYFEGIKIPISEINMVASLPEGRGHGYVRSLMSEVLRDFRAKGDIFAVLHPFSFAFYRKFGFDLIEKSMTQKCPVGELREFTCDLSVRQVRRTEDVVACAEMYRRFAEGKNLADVRDAGDWEYRGNGEFGRPGWGTEGKQQYAYIFSDNFGDHAYLKFVFDPGPEGPFTGDLRAIDLVYDSPASFRSVLGFIYGMRAKLINVILEVPQEIDLSVMIPECDHTEQTLGGHLMGRVLNVEKVFSCLSQPKGTGTYSVRVTDRFLPENTGVYKIEYADGSVRSVTAEKDGDYDLSVGIETFSQLSAGLYDLSTAVYRADTVICGKEDILNQVFRRKTILTS